MNSASDKHNQKVGLLGEKIAADFLKEKGYDILERNCRYRLGEIDIIAQKNKITVFVEVKTIISNSDFLPEYHFSRGKINNLLRACYLYLKERKMSLEEPWQVDLIAVELDSFLRKKEIRHWANVVEDSW